ncbi:MAG: 50S ribosomal protein L11 methyltransferase [Epsilonproteobacteria bacterium]|nr:50S ribosomal protein L11 methyltransferase [Campylobacterota bacterium]
MNKTYNELLVTTDDFHSYFIDFIFDLGHDAIEEKNGNIILRSEDNLDIVVFALQEYSKKLSLALNKKINLKTKITVKKNEDWVQKYKDSVQPIEVGNFYIRADWEKEKENKINIIINPALAFGSGHHESTHGCILQIEKYLKQGDTFLDVGCGSGILSIAGAKLGASVDICDTDELALKSSIENFKLNNEKITTSWIGSIQGTDKKYNVVVANIIADILTMLANDLIKRVKVNGYLILSGILDIYIDRVEKRFSSLKIVEKYKKNEWFTLVLQKAINGTK